MAPHPPQPQSLPPQTPWITHPRFADESLLLATQPIFDVSLGEESEWGMESPRLDSSTPRVKAVALVHGREEKETGEEGCMTLNLVDYLPEELSHVGKREEEKRTTTHKRDLSVTLLADIPQKKAKAPVSRTASTNKDDFYSRRLSTSRPPSAGSLQSPVLPSLTLPSPPSSFASRSASSSSSGSGHVQSSTHAPHDLNTASSRLEESIRQPRSAIPTERSSVEPHASRAGEAKTLAPPVVVKRTSASALSRYLAKSTITNPIKVTPVTPPLQPQTAAALNFTTPIPSSFSSSSSAHLDKTKDKSDEQDRSSTVSPIARLDEAPSSSIILVASTSKASLSKSSSSSNDTGSSRRSSLSGKVVNFLSGLVRSASSSSLQEQDVILPSGHHSQDGDQKVGGGEDELAGKERQEVQEARHSIMPTQGTRPNPHQSTKPRSQIAPLTKPVPFSRPFHHIKNPLQPTRAQPAVTKYSQPPSTKTKTTPRSATTSAFASAALARLPPPGKGATSAGKRVEVKDGERAMDLGARRGVFERLAGPSTTSSSKSASRAPQSQRTSTAAIHRTIPVVGRTPGKASQLRAQQRSKFDVAVRQKIEEKERQARQEAERKEKEEDEDYKRRRKETVIWAKPVPSMYHQART